MSDLFRKQEKIFIMLAALYLGGFAFAQDGVVVKQKHITLESSAIYTLLGDENPESPEEMAKYLFDLPLEKIIAGSEKANNDAELREMILYLQNGNFRMDMDAPEGKMSTILRADLDSLYNVIWPQKKYMAMSLQQMRQMREGVEQNMSQVQNRPDISAMLEKLPPEAREKALEAMKNAGNMQSMYGQQAEDQQQSAEKTDRKRTIAGYDCEEWIVRKGNNLSSHWLASSKPALAEKIRNFSKTWGAGLGMEKQSDSEKEVWQLVPGTIPIESRTFRQGGMGRPEIDIVRVESIAEKKLEEKVFRVPEGFAPGSMFDMMNMGPRKR